MSRFAIRFNVDLSGSPIGTVMRRSGFNVQRSTFGVQRLTTHVNAVGEPSRFARGFEESKATRFGHSPLNVEP
jgi:hypothetical protein